MSMPGPACFGMLCSCKRCLACLQLLLATTRSVCQNAREAACGHVPHGLALRQPGTPRESLCLVLGAAVS